MMSLKVSFRDRVVKLLESRKIPFTCSQIVYFYWLLLEGLSLKYGQCPALALYISKEFSCFSFVKKGCCFWCTIDSAIYIVSVILNKCTIDRGGERNTVRRICRRRAKIPVKTSPFKKRISTQLFIDGKQGL